MPALPFQHGYRAVQVIDCGGEVQASGVVDVALGDVQLVPGVGGAGAIADGHGESVVLQDSQHGGHDAVQVPRAGERHQLVVTQFEMGYQDSR